MRAIALMVSLSVGACSTATIHRVRGPAYEAEIVDSDANGLHVLGDDGRVHDVSREEITDVDHPGNVVLTVGAILVAIGGLTAISVLNDNRDSRQARETATALAIVYGGPGLAMMIGGGVTYIGSKVRASAFEAGGFPALSRPPPAQYVPPPPRPLPPAAAPAAPAPPEVVPAPPEVVPAPPAESPR